jgi:hypothetical protein
MLALLALAPLLVRVGVISPLGGFGAAMGAWIVGSLAGLASGVIGLLRADTRPLAWAACAVGLILVATLALVGSRIGRVPIHDITTDFEDPPSFVTAAKHPSNQGRDLTYPHGRGNTPELQRQAYPEVSGAIRVSGMSAAEVQEAVVEAAAALGWQVTWSSLADGIVEAEVVSGLFRFVDDVVVRIRPVDDGAGFAIDLRSTSRVGDSDLGANAARINAFRELWRAAYGAGD